MMLFATSIAISTISSVCFGLWVALYIEIPNSHRAIIWSAVFLASVPSLKTPSAIPFSITVAISCFHVIMPSAAILRIGSIVSSASQSAFCIGQPPSGNCVFVELWKALMYIISLSLVVAHLLTARCRTSLKRLML